MTSGRASGAGACTRSCGHGRPSSSAISPPATLIADIFAGRSVGYSTFVGYDEIAHHSGIERPETLRALSQLDQQFGRIVRAAETASRPYQFVVLSDHGQTDGTRSGSATARPSSSS